AVPPVPTALPPAPLVVPPWPPPVPEPALASEEPPSSSLRLPQLAPTVSPERAKPMMTTLNMISRSRTLDDARQEEYHFSPSIYQDSRKKWSKCSERGTICESRSRAPAREVCVWASSRR